MMLFKNNILVVLCRNLQRHCRRYSNMDPPRATDFGDHFVWLDMEMTGLDVNADHILEVACVITKPDLQKTDNKLNLIVHQPKEVLDSMNDWCKVHHGRSGLTEASLNSEVTVADAEKQLFDFIIANTAGTNFLAGNSVYMDRLFLRKYMPSVDNLLHYRIIDVSVVKELCKNWFPFKYADTPRKKYSHRAVDDIYESINELSYYRENFFISSQTK